MEEIILAVIILSALICAFAAVIIFSIILFILVCTCKLYLRTSSYDRLLKVYCRVFSPFAYSYEHYLIERQLYEDDKKRWKETIKIIIFSDVDIYTSNDAVLRGIHEGNLVLLQDVQELLCSSSKYKFKYNGQSLFKTLKLKFGPDFNIAERKAFARHSFLHILLLFQNIIYEMFSTGTKFQKKSNEDCARQLLDLNIVGKHYTPTEDVYKCEGMDFDTEFLKGLWEDPEFQRCYSQEKERGMTDSLDYLFAPEQLKRFSQPDFLPTNADIEHLNIVPIDCWATGYVPIMTTILDVGENRKIELCHFPYRIRKYKNSYIDFDHDLSFDVWDFVIRIGRAERKYFAMHYLGAPDSATLTELYTGSLGRSIYLDERILSEDKFDSFLRCLTDFGKFDEKCIIANLRELSSYKYDTIIPDQNTNCVEYCWMPAYFVIAYCCVLPWICLSTTFEFGQMRLMVALRNCRIPWPRIRIGRQIDI